MARGRAGRGRTGRDGDGAGRGRTGQDEAGRGRTGQDGAGHQGQGCVIISPEPSRAVGGGKGFGVCTPSPILDRWERRF